MGTEPGPVRLLKQRTIWEIERKGKAVTTRVGERWGKQKQKTVTLGTPDRARAKYEELLAAARADGFRALGEIDPPAPSARDDRLEAGIREHRDDPAPYLVYADWLQSHGSAVGELIVLAHRKKQKQADALARTICKLPAGMAEVESRFGLWRSLTINNTVDHSEASWDPVPMVRALFSSPLCVALEELRLGMFRWDFQDEPAVIAEAGTHAWARDLERLAVGEVHRHIDMAHHAIGDVGKAITKAFPRLRALKLRSGSQDWRGGKESFGFGQLALPKLEELVIETCAMTTKRIKMLLSAELPALHKLEIWFGATSHEQIAKVGAVAPVWDGKTFPKLTHLGLCNSELTTDFVRLVPASPLAARLEVLDLSKGTLDDNDARELAAEAKRFPKLRRLVLDESYVTPAVLQQVKAAFRGVEVSAKHPKERYDDEDDDDDGRYVSVAE
ncbi:MAG TPA: TIGR02996 domain-containing protein [Kofleriaceae bacterium]|nr:TIGR02996 domain-containing protein [Kofleriaceae bacterium]